MAHHQITTLERNGHDDEARDKLRTAMVAAGGNQGAAAELLGVSRRTVIRMVGRLGLGEQVAALRVTLGGMGPRHAQGAGSRTATEIVRDAVERAAVRGERIDHALAACDPPPRARVTVDDVLRVVREAGARGATCDEVEAKLGASHQSVSPRFHEAKASGAIVPAIASATIRSRKQRAEVVNATRETRAGRKATVFVLASTRAGDLDRLRAAHAAKTSH